MNTPIRDWRAQRVWIIGASSGIGAALAVALLERGASVAVSARRTEALRAVVAGHGAARVLAFDLNDRAALGPRLRRTVPDLARHRPGGVLRRRLCADARLAARRQ
jgi:NADP-dependent 3-hydroxy acid dehydrogenase YdfG